MTVTIFHRSPGPKLSTIVAAAGRRKSPPRASGSGAAAQDAFVRGPRGANACASSSWHARGKRAVTSAQANESCATT